MLGKRSSAQSERPKPRSLFIMCFPSLNRPVLCCVLEQDAEQSTCSLTGGRREKEPDKKLRYKTMGLVVEFLPNSLSPATWR